MARDVRRHEDMRNYSIGRLGLWVLVTLRDKHVIEHWSYSYMRKENDFAVIISTVTIQNLTQEIKSKQGKTQPFKQVQLGVFCRVSRFLQPDRAFCSTNGASV